jgi:hypothetical protein
VAARGQNADAGNDDYDDDATTLLFERRGEGMIVGNCKAVLENSSCLINFRLTTFCLGRP